ncbi:exocyst complex protein exo70 [Ceratobasidium sp. AG-Ba]|nr:exocyst complex protein exo70 [Ceratobasidium sp. AG-Ba]
MNNMEDEMADIELVGSMIDIATMACAYLFLHAKLEQHLKKTSDISRKMTGILAKFDSRLVKLEKTIRPLHSATQSLTRLATTMAEAMRQILTDDGVYQCHGERKAGRCSGGEPSPERAKAGELHIYVDALEKLNANIAFQTGDPRAERWPVSSKPVQRSSASFTQNLLPKLTHTQRLTLLIT